MSREHDNITKRSLLNHIIRQQEFIQLALDRLSSQSDYQIAHRIHRLARQSAHLAEAAKALAHLANLPVAPTLPPDA